MNEKIIDNDPLNDMDANFKYQKFNDHADGIVTMSQPNMNNQFRNIQINEDQHSSVWDNFGNLHLSFMDRIKRKIPVKYTIRLNLCYTYFQKAFKILGPILLIILFIMCIIYWSRIPKQDTAAKQCLTKECLISASFIISNLNTSIDKCSNFYQFACNLYAKPFSSKNEADSPTAQASHSLISSFGNDMISDYFRNGRSRRLLRFDRPSTRHLTELNIHALINSLRSILQDYSKSNNQAKYKVAKFYYSCTDSTWRNWNGVRTLLERITKLTNGIWLFDRNASNITGANISNMTNGNKDWPTNLFSSRNMNTELKFNETAPWMDSISKMQTELHVPIFADFIISTYSKTPKLVLRKYVTGMLQLLVKESGIDFLNNEIQARLKIFKDDVSTISNELSRLKRISKTTALSEEINLGKIIDSRTGLNWTKVLTEYFSDSGVNFDQNYVIYSRYSQYLQGLPTLVSNLELNFTKPIFSRMMNNYIFWNALDTFAWHLSHEYYSQFASYHMVEHQNLEIDCFYLTHQLFDTVLGAIYVSDYVHNKTTNEVKLLNEYLKESLENHVTKLDWMDDETKKNVGKRLNEMEILYDVPEIMRKDEKLNYAYRSLHISYNYLENIVSTIKYSREIYNRILSGISETSEENWSYNDITAYDAHIGVYLKKDKVFIPPGILHLPIYNRNTPSELKFGGFGSMVGTAIGILVGEFGMISKKEEKTRNLWSSTTLDKFSKRKKCVYNQIYNATQSYFQVGSYIMSYLVQSLESIVNGVINEATGLDISLDAFDKWKKNKMDADGPKMLPGVPFSAHELFYIGYAQTYCHEDHFFEEFSRVYWKQDAPPYEVLVNEILRQLPDFEKTFNCPVGSPMNPPEKCRAII